MKFERFLRYEIADHDGSNMRLLVAVVAATGGLYVALRAAQHLLARSKVMQLIDKRREKREQAILRLRQKLHNKKPPEAVCEEILKLDTQRLRDKIRSGEIDMKNALYAYQAQALVVHEKTNCIVDIIEEAEEFIDDLLANGRKDEVLYGVPVSVKEHLTVKGYDVTLGCTKYLNDPASFDMDIIKLLKAEGAIPFVKCNNPQTLMSYETTNPIFGSTRNPQDTSRSAGGSSGGEGAIVAGGAALLAIGTDIGGSIRVPAHMNGVFGLKPTPSRTNDCGLLKLPIGGCIPGCLGPLGRDVTGLYLFMKALCSDLARKLDPMYSNRPMDDKIFASREKLRIGYFLTDPFMETVPAVQRAVLEAKVRLEALGHEVIEWEPPLSMEKIFELWNKGIFADGGPYYRNSCAGEPLDEAVRDLMPYIRKPVWLKKLMAAFIYPFNRPAANNLLWTCGVKGLSEYWSLVAEILDANATLLASWRSNRLDGVLSPTFACPPLPYGAYVEGTLLGDMLPKCGVNSMFYNLFPCPAGVVPITTVTTDDIIKMADYPEHDRMHRAVKAGMAGTEGLSVSVQVATLPHEDELCLRIMRELEESSAGQGITAWLQQALGNR